MISKGIPKVNIGLIWVKSTSTYKTGDSDHYHVICTMMKSCFHNTESNLLTY